MSPRTVTVRSADVHVHVARLVRVASEGAARVLITRHGQPLAALVSVADLHQLAGEVVTIDDAADVLDLIADARVSE